MHNKERKKKTFLVCVSMCASIEAIPVQICAVKCSKEPLCRVCAKRRNLLPAERLGCERCSLSHSASLSPLRALPPHASTGDPPPRPLIAEETALKEKIRIAPPPHFKLGFNWFRLLPMEMQTKCFAIRIFKGALICSEK